MCCVDFWCSGTGKTHKGATKLACPMWGSISQRSDWGNMATCQLSSMFVPYHSKMGPWDNLSYQNTFVIPISDRTTFRHIAWHFFSLQICKEYTQWGRDSKLGPMGHDPYGSKSTGNGSHHWCLYYLEILICVPRTHIDISWWVPFEF